MRNVHDHTDSIHFGDDPAPDADRDWQEGLAEARERNIPIHTVGLGNPLVGSPIPLRGDEVLRHQGEVVLTRLKERPLEAMARLTGGSYTPARTHTFDLGQLFEERIEPRPILRPGPVHEERHPAAQPPGRGRSDLE